MNKIKINTRKYKKTTNIEQTKTSGASNLEPEMRLYGVDENYFKTIDELLKYCRQNHFSTNCLTILDYYRKFYNYKDVIRKTNSETSYYFAISNENGYVWYSEEHGENWEFTHGQIRALYKPFRDHGIVFEDDIYVRQSEKHRSILTYCRKKNLFNMSKKDKE